MQCSCGARIRHDHAPADFLCQFCGKAMARDADDFLLYGAEGLIKEHRDGQVTMGRAVEDTIRTKNALVVEGPVGVGKSFAYLIPALLSGQRTIVSTAQKPLQRQLAEVDGPLLLKALAYDAPNATVVMLKGKNNYGCLLHASVTADVPEFAQWLATSTTADLSEYTGKQPAKIRDATAEGCSGRKCPLAKKCGYMALRARAADAKLLVVNHSLVAFDLRFGPMRVLGPYSTLIIDEAHKAVGSFRSAFEESISNRGQNRVLNRIDALNAFQLPVRSQQVKDAWDFAFSQLQVREGALAPDPFGPAGLSLEEILTDLRTFIDARIGVKSRGVVENADIAELPGNLDPHDFNNAIQLSRALHRSAAALKAIRIPNKNTLVTAEKGQGGLIRCKATPVSIGALVGAKLGAIPSLIFTSATMAVAGQFDAFIGELGLTRLTDERNVPTDPVPPLRDGTPGPVFSVKAIAKLAVPTPFDYQKQGAVLYIPRHVKPAVSEMAGETSDAREAYLDSVASETLKLVQASGGNALVLFTATSDMREVGARLAEAAPHIPWLSQDAAAGESADVVLKRFIATPGSVILGLKSFWEGVSVNGDKLWLVVVTKLPFPSPEDPLNKLLEQQLQEQLKDSTMSASDKKGFIFNRLSFAPMMTDLRQGAGRLIRTKTDRGVLAILDSRVWSGKTGAAAVPGQVTPAGYGPRIIAALGFNSNWTSETGLVLRRFERWRKGGA